MKSITGKIYKSSDLNPTMPQGMKFTGVYTNWSTAQEGTHTHTHTQFFIVATMGLMTSWKTVLV
jgi:hypothetical protein